MGQKTKDGVQIFAKPSCSSFQEALDVGSMDWLVLKPASTKRRSRAKGVPICFCFAFTEIDGKDWMVGVTNESKAPVLMKVPLNTSSRDFDVIISSSHQVVRKALVEEFVADVLQHPDSIIVSEIQQFKLVAKPQKQIQPPHKEPPKRKRKLEEPTVERYDVFVAKCKT